MCRIHGTMRKRGAKERGAISSSKKRAALSGHFHEKKNMNLCARRIRNEKDQWGDEKQEQSSRHNRSGSRERRNTWRVNETKRDEPEKKLKNK